MPYKNKDYKNAHQRKYYAKNKDRLLKKQKEYNIKNKDHIREQGKKYYLRNKEHHKKVMKENHLKSAFGIDIQEYNKLFDEQNGCCAICGRHQSELSQTLYVDHNHETNKIRGLLCINCNALLGHAKDNSNVLEKAMHYLDVN